MKQKIVNNIWKLIAVGAFVLVIWFIALWAFGAFDKDFCNTVSLEHYTEYGCQL